MKKEVELLDAWKEGLKEGELFGQEVMRLRGEIEFLECEAQAFRILARLVAEYGLCNPDLQVARARPEQMLICRTDGGEGWSIAAVMMVEDVVRGRTPERIKPQTPKQTQPRKPTTNT